MAPNLDRDEAKGEENLGFEPADEIEKKDDNTNSSISSIPELTDGKKKKKKKKEKAEVPEFPPVPFFELFRFASKTDWFLGFLASLGAIGTGIMFPIMLILFGDITNAFVGQGIDQDLLDEINCNISTDPNYNYTIPPYVGSLQSLM